MDAIPGEIAGLLKEVRAHLANSGDPWERRRELIVAINQYVEGGEADLFVGTVREMSRIGATYANLIQTLAQMNTGPDAAARLSQLMAGTMPTAAFLMPGAFNPANAFGMPNAAQQAFTAPFMGSSSGSSAAPLPGMDYFRMVTDFMNAQATSLKAAGAMAGGSSGGDGAAEAPPS
jgi:hypothetical protein